MADEGKKAQTFIIVVVAAAVVSIGIVIAALLWSSSPDIEVRVSTGSAGISAADAEDITQLLQHDCLIVDQGSILDRMKTGIRKVKATIFGPDSYGPVTVYEGSSRITFEVVSRAEGKADVEASIGGGPVMAMCELTREVRGWTVTRFIDLLPQ